MGPWEFKLGTYKQPSTIQKILNSHSLSPKKQLDLQNGRKKSTEFSGMMPAGANWATPPCVLEVVCTGCGTLSEPWSIYDTVFPSITKVHRIWNQKVKTNRQHSVLYLLILLKTFCFQSLHFWALSMLQSWCPREGEFHQEHGVSHRIRK